MRLPSSMLIDGRPIVGG